MATMFLFLQLRLPCPSPRTGGLTPALRVAAPAPLARARSKDVLDCGCPLRLPTLSLPTAVLVAASVPHWRPCGQ